MKLNFISFLPGVVWLIVTIVLLVMPNSDIPQSSFFDLVHFDKWVHIGMFGLLMLLWCFPFFNSNFKWKRILLTIGLSVVGYGVIMEFIQRLFTTDRDFDYTDMLADGVGVFIAGVWLNYRYKIKSRKQKNKPL